MRNQEEWIVHICPQETWQAARAKGEYRAPSLENEGFIHCSKPGQVLDVANRFYRSEPDLVLLWIHPELVEAEVRWEAVENGEVFPHIYGGLNTSAVSEVTDFVPDKNGIFQKIIDPD